MRGSCAALILIAICSTCSPAQSNPAGAAKPGAAGALALSASAPWVEVSDRISPLSLPDGRVVVTVGDTIYMIGPDGRVSWHYSGDDQVSAEPVFRPDRHEIAIVGLDLGIICLNADTGSVLWKTPASGSAQFTSVKPYGDGYLVLADQTEAIVASQTTGDQSQSPLTLEYWGKAESDHWQAPFPNASQLVVAGERIYGVKYEGNAVTFQEIRPGAAKKQSD